jgi:hypothetical protein
MSGWWKKDPEGKGRAKSRWFIIKSDERLIQYFEYEGDAGKGKGLKGAIELNSAEKIICADPKMQIHTMSGGKKRIWGLTSELPNQVEQWAELLSKVVPNVPIEGRKAINTEDMAAMMSDMTKDAPKKGDASGPSALFADRVDVRAAMLQRASKEAKYGVQFSPYEGTADGVMICGITEGGPGDGQVVAGEKVVGINGHSCIGKTYPEAVELMRTVVNGTWSVLKLDVQFRELYGKCGYEYEKTQDTELSMKLGDRVRIISDEDNGWIRGELDGEFGWFPSTYVELEPEIEIERYVAPDLTPPEMKREGPFPELKVWNHGKITRQVQEERAKAYDGDLVKGVFLARKKDASCYSVCVRFPDVDGEAALKFVLFEKIGDVWHADKSDEACGDTVTNALEAHLKVIGYPGADAIPKPEA